MDKFLFEYIREAYRVPADKGRRIRFEGSLGTIVGVRGPYLRITLDTDPSRRFNVHPTWEMEYLPVSEEEK